MDQELLDRLSPITPEEKEILAGHREIDRTLYFDPRAERKNVVDSSLVLKNGKMIDIRPNVRFVHFPEHTHNYVEFVYMCQGTTTHIIDGQTITLQEGDLLFLSQHARQEILPAGRDDIAVNFMIQPPFFAHAFQSLGAQENPLRTFLISCLTDKTMGSSYLYFKAAGVLPVQNLMENLLWTMLQEGPNRRTLAEKTLELLFLNLANDLSRVPVSGNSWEENTMIKVLAQIEENYRTARLTDLAGQTGTDLYTLSRLVRRRTGCTFKQLLQKKRLSQACFMLEHTRLPAADIAAAVGYENAAYFYRLFEKTYHMPPRKYRLMKSALASPAPSQDNQ